jgi:hypothetical protein
MGSLQLGEEEDRQRVAQPRRDGVSNHAPHVGVERQQRDARRLQLGDQRGRRSEANGYSSSGKALTNEVWTVGASAGQYKFDADDVVWTGTGGSIPNIKFAVIWLSAAASAGRHLLCRSQLTSSQFTLASGNTLTLQMNSAGILTLA